MLCSGIFKGHQFAHTILLKKKKDKDIMNIILFWWQEITDMPSIIKPMPDILVNVREKE